MLSTHTELWDISPPVDAGTPVFPGDTPYSQRWTVNMETGSSVNVSAISLSSHVGAHADAPLHYEQAGKAIGALALEPYIGRCRVIHAVGVSLIRPEDIAHALKADVPPRVLVRTYEHPPLDHFDNSLTAFTPETIEHLADLGVQLIGTDSASIDPAASKTLDCHHVLRRRNMRVLENLVLDAVPEGDYELIALPLKLVTADASPVRAVLRALV